MSRTLLIGCGVLRRELEFLVARNGWDLETRFVDSLLHTDPAALAQALAEVLALPAGRRVLCLGECHPLIDTMADQAGAVRTPCRNCLELLLGAERFTAEVAGGAFFLQEEWAGRWDEFLDRTVGDHDQIAREIFHEDRNCMVAVRTPCSGDFREAAESAGQKAGLPVRWLETGLDHLEHLLAETLARSERHGA